MGGSAFNRLLPSSFPRIPPAVYTALKARFLPILETAYTHVQVPSEAPEKRDHGDVDFIVAEPTHPFPPGLEVPHEHIRHLLGASEVIPMPGNRTSNYAVPIPTQSWAAFGCAEEEERARDQVDGDIYYQMDVHVCESIEEWKRVVFFHAYGDLGMILGLLARNNGLLLGVNGLKVRWRYRDTII
jgi:hypothetical protein